MRRLLSTFLTIAGIGLGLCAVGILIALEWPDATSDAWAVRGISGIFALDVLVGIAISWPFLWIADKLSPQNSADNTRATTTE
jgi:hypothetical protein